MTAPVLYVWRWRTTLTDRFGTTCRVLARGRSMNSALIQFEADGVRHVVSRFALRRAP